MRASARYTLLRATWVWFVTALKAKIIAISGGTCSGKSTFAKRSPGSIVISTDDFYLNQGELTPGPDGTLNWEDPDSADLAACRASCEMLARGEAVDVPIYDIPTSSRIGFKRLEAPSGGLVIIEGLFAFEEQITSLADVLIFLDVSLDVRRTRRLARDLAVGVEVDLILTNLCNAEASEREKLESLRKQAHVVLTESDISDYWQSAIRLCG